MNRRGFLQSILAAGVAPAFVGASVLMPVRKLWTPEATFTLPTGFRANFIGYTITNNGAATLTVQGITWEEFYAPAGDVVLRPGETLRYDAKLRAYSRG